MIPALRRFVIAIPVAFLALVSASSFAAELGAKKD